MDFKDMVRINKFKLDVECERHSSLYHDVADALAKAEIAMNAAEDNYKAVASRRLLALRNMVETGELKVKWTESIGSAMVDVDPEVVSALSDYRQKQADYLTLKAGVKSMEHRKDSLDNLVFLWGKSYYATPSGYSPEAAASSQQRSKLNNKDGD